MHSKVPRVFLFSLVSLGALLLAVVLVAHTSDRNIYTQTFDADLSTLAETERGFGPISVFFKGIAEEKGGAYAFELLRQAPLPSNIDVHLLGHLIGDELYKQEGLEGMRYCTHDFRNACSHSVVIGALLADGLAVFDRVHEVCKEAPGGSGAYTMCFHGFGHGVLAYTDYEMPDAVELCKRTGTDAYRQREYEECVGGVVMEMLSGVHDQEVWLEKANMYLSDSNPLKLCQSPYMPEEVRPICYTYITPEMFKVAGVNLGNPDSSDYGKAFRYCDGVTGEEDQRACYGGFGKEFVVLAQERDIRSVEKITDAQLENIIFWCQSTDVEIGVSACLHDALNSLYWGGENEFETAVRFCELIGDTELQNTCFDNQIANVKNYRSERDYRERFCSVVPEIETEKCKSELLGL